jgi:antitoxin component of RelBE/YafQ-DinJ toxin-antitoxin module
MSKAFSLVAKKSVQENKTPFEISRQIPKKETLQAMQENDDILTHPENYNFYKNIVDLFTELNSKTNLV